MRKTKVRIVGDPELVAAVEKVIIDNFECSVRSFPRMPTRYSRSDSPGVSTYITIEKKKEGRRT